jgi:hypothetical protein
MGYNSNDGEWVRDFHISVNPSGIDSGDAYHLGSEKKRDLFDQAGHLSPVGDFHSALGGRLRERLGMIFLAKPARGSIQAIANAIFRLQFVVRRRGKRDAPFNASVLKSLAYLLPE